MKPVSLIAALLALSPVLAAADDRAAGSQGVPANGTQNPLPRHFPTNDRFVKELAGNNGASTNNQLAYRGGPVIQSALVVPIYWGAAWGSVASPANLAKDLNSYIAGSNGGGFGKTGEYNTITQYYQLSGTSKQYIALSALGSSATQNVYYDASAPATNVTDAAVQAEILKAVPASNLNPNTVYEVFLPSSSYSSNGSSTSCGGTNLQYCAYHGSFSTSVSGSPLNIKYAVIPYPNCGGCQTAGFSDAQNFEHFIAHETREAVTDPNSNGWYDNRGYEADDKCAWTPTPFTDSTAGTNSNTNGGAFAYQYEWSNATGSCVKTR